MRHAAPELATQKLLDELHRIRPFDTAFHRTIPAGGRQAASDSAPLRRKRSSALRIPRFVPRVSDGRTRSCGRREGGPRTRDSGSPWRWGQPGGGAVGQLDPSGHWKAPSWWAV
jgi:hypothetical protein